MLPTSKFKIIPEIFKDAELKSGKVALEKRSEVFNWLKREEGMLLLYGKPGRGKTWTAYGALNVLKQAKPNNSSYAFLNLTDFYNIWRENSLDPWANNKLLGELADVDFLAFDDIGMRDPTDGFFEYFICLVNKRSEKVKHLTIFTTNLTAEQLRNSYSERFMSRVVKGGKVIEFDGPDLREK